jgi:hypothetical protein
VTLVFGAIWFVLRQDQLSEHNVTNIATVAMGMGMVHFIYSARIWKMSDPEVRVAVNLAAR